MDYYKEYASKLCSPEEAVRIVKDGDWVDYHQCCSFPTRLDKALAKRKGELKDINVRSAISCDPVAVVEEDPDQETFTYNLWHCLFCLRQGVYRPGTSVFFSDALSQYRFLLSPWCG